MATIRVQLSPHAGIPSGTSLIAARHKVVNGTNFPVPSLAFDAATTNSAYWIMQLDNYGAGNITASIDWYADTATTGDVKWQVKVGAITPNTDSQDVETKALAAAQTVVDSHLGTTGQRIHNCTIDITAIDSMAVMDMLVVELSRLGSDAADTMAGDALVPAFEISYSDV